MKTQTSLFLDTVLLAQITDTSDAEDLLLTSLVWAIEKPDLRLMNPTTSKRLHKVTTEEKDALVKHNSQLL